MVISFATWMSDMDSGEMFHNFNLDPRIRPYSGVNVENFVFRGQCGKFGNGESGGWSVGGLRQGVDSPVDAVVHGYATQSL